MIVRKCQNCGHEWAPRKLAPPKKCPRCQHPYEPVAEIDGDIETVNPLAGATPQELRYLAGVMEILRGNDEVLSGGIRRAVDNWRKRSK